MPSMTARKSARSQAEASLRLGKRGAERIDATAIKIGDGLAPGIEAAPALGRIALVVGDIVDGAAEAHRWRTSRRAALARQNAHREIESALLRDGRRRDRTPRKSRRRSRASGLRATESPKAARPPRPARSQAGMRPCRHGPSRSADRATLSLRRASRRAHDRADLHGEPQILDAAGEGPRLLQQLIRAQRRAPARPSEAARGASPRRASPRSRHAAASVSCGR